MRPGNGNDSLVIEKASNEDTIGNAWTSEKIYGSQKNL